MLICIASEFGSGGHEIGRLVSETLGYAFYDRELVTEAASRSSIAPEALERADERRENAWLHSLVYDADDHNLRGISANEAMFRIQSAVILDAAQDGDCVFVGRYAGGSWGRPHTYDLCVNSSTLGIKRTAAALVTLIRKMQ